MLVDDLHEFSAAFERPGASAGVLEIRDDIDHLDIPGGGKDIVQLLHDHAAVIGRHFLEDRLAELEGVDGAEVGWAFHQHDVARIDKETCGKIQTLLAAGGHDDMIGRGVDGVLLKQAVGNLLSQAQQTLRRTVLQRGASVLFKHGIRRRLHLFYREQLRGGETAGKGDNFGLVDKREQLADVGSLHVVHSFCEFNHGFPPCVIVSADCAIPVIVSSIPYTSLGVSIAQFLRVVNSKQCIFAPEDC